VTVRLKVLAAIGSRPEQRVELHRRSPPAGIGVPKVTTPGFRDTMPRNGHVMVDADRRSGYRHHKLDNPLSRDVYDILSRAAAETVQTIAADAKHLGAAIGMTAVLHTWGQNWD
jgi:hypothetical protein